MSEAGHNANAQLKSIIDRVESVETEIKSLQTDRADIYTEARSNGFDVKALREIVRFRKQDAQKRAEHEAIVDTYKNSLGMT